MARRAAWDRRVVVAVLSAATAVGAPLAARAPLPGYRAPAGEVTFVVNTAAGHRPISPLIYGINADKSVGSAAAFTAEMDEARPGLVRLGGNRWTAYNWENNDSNAGSDYLYENDDYLTPSTAPGAAVLPTVEAARTAGATALVTVPIAGYVAADRNPPGDVRRSGAGYLSSRFRIDAPSAPGPMGQAPDPDGKYVYQDQFVYWLHQAVPGEPLIFALDNEPDLWDQTHAEIHPQPTTYLELLTKDLEYARAIKKVLPTALVTGPVSYGWEGYLSLQDAPGSARYGNFLDWYLAQVKVADGRAGKTLIDDLDLHWYPEATGGGARITGTGTSPALVAAREQAPRSLWDPSYVEDSWITQDSTGGKAIDLVPRLEAMIRAHNPGMNLDFSEWDYGGGQDISGGIATADVLGIFGRYGVHASAWWPLGQDESYALGAFAIYRNYDGRGGAFGDTEVAATTSSPTLSSIYASVQGAAPAHVVVVVINKSLSSQPARLRIPAGPGLERASVYTLTSASPSPRRAPDLRAAAPGTFSYDMPAQSVSVIVPAHGP